MDSVDEYFPLPTRALDKPFALSVEDVFSIQGRGTVVTGRIEQGIVRTGEEVQVIGITPTPIKSVVTGSPHSVLQPRPWQAGKHALLYAGKCNF